MTSLLMKTVFIYTCSNDGTIKLWDERDLGLKATLKGIDAQRLE